MPIYMSQFSYTNEAVASLIKEPEDRSAAFREQVEQLGGRVIVFYYRVDKYDGVTIYEVPDSVAVSTLISASRAAGHLKEIEVIELHTVEDTMEGIRRAHQQEYQGIRGARRWLDETNYGRNPE